MVSGKEDLYEKCSVRGTNVRRGERAYSIKEVDTCLADQEGSGQEGEDEVGFSENEGDSSDES